MLFLVNPVGIIFLVDYIKSVPRELDESAASGYQRTTHATRSLDVGQSPG